MTHLSNYITDDFVSFLTDYNLEYNHISENLIIFSNKQYSLKIYDCLGHGFGVTINVCKNYCETIYEDDGFNLTWAFKYFNLKEEAVFDARTKKQYLKNLPILINDLKNIIPKLNSMDWNDLMKWVKVKSYKAYG